MRRSVSRLSMAIGLVCCGLSAASSLHADSSEATFSGLNGKIAFTRRIIEGMPAVTREDDIYVINPDGTGERNLTRTVYGEYQPDWSSDGTKLLFWGGPPTRIQDIYVMDADGSNIVNLTNDDSGDSSPSWSPDSSQLAYTSFDAGIQQIYTMRADGGDRVRISSGDSGAYMPAWSPDGNWIAFMSGKNVVIAKPDGSQAGIIFTGLEFPGPISWSPDGRKIAFVSGRQLHVLNSDGSDQHSIAAADFATDADWSPDGTQIAIVESSRSPERTANIIVMQVDGTNPRRLTNHPPGVGILDLDWGTNTDFAFPSTGGPPVRSASGWLSAIFIGTGILLVAAGEWALRRSAGPLVLEACVQDEAEAAGTRWPLG
jgi:Tol biopolymer transport system component